MRTRDGRLIEARRYSFVDMEMPSAEVLADFAVRYYDDADIPAEILFPPDMEWSGPLGALLSDKVGHSVRARVPRRGDKKRLVELAERNARQAFVDKQRQEGSARNAVERLQRALRLRRPPESIECFDISHLGGEGIVASAVRFENGAPHKQLYRHYKVRSTKDQDDFQAMYEVLGRRARRGLEEGDLPALMIIDGGKGQLNAARAALEDHGIDEVELISLAKARPVRRAIDDARDPERSAERVFILGQKNAVVLRQDSAELYLLSRARDEAHRFAIAFQKRSRRKKMSRSALDDIPGVGPKRRQALLKAFGSLARIRAAPEEKLAGVVGARVAAAIKHALAKSTT
jgi:excinuclease ABC subunit C